MIINNKVNYYSVGEVAQMVGRSSLTIRLWFRAKEYADENKILTDMPPLPIPRRDLDHKGTRFFTMEQVEQLINFRNNLPRGALSFYNKEKSWGERGKQMRECDEFLALAEKDLGEDLSDLTK